MSVWWNISHENSGISRSEIQDRVADLCGISIHTLRKLLTEESKMEENETLHTPGYICPRINKKVSIDDFQKCALEK